MPWKLFGRGEKSPPPAPSGESFRREREPGHAVEPGEPVAVTAARVVMVPVDGSPASLEAVALACNLARRRRGKVYVIHVIEVPRALPLDAEMEVEAASGEEVLQRAEQVAREVDFDVDGELLQARDPGQAIVDEAVARRVELIVMGVDYRNPMADVYMGRLAQYVLKNAPCEVWLIRRPAPREVPA